MRADPTRNYVEVTGFEKRQILNVMQPNIDKSSKCHTLLLPDKSHKIITEPIRSFQDAQRHNRFTTDIRVDVPCKTLYSVHDQTPELRRKI